MPPIKVIYSTRIFVLNEFVTIFKASRKKIIALYIHLLLFKIILIVKANELQFLKN